MTGPRLALAMALGLAVASASQAKVSCPDRLTLDACIGVAAAGTVRFCFEPDLACSGTGVVRSVGAPSSPFGIVGLRVQGALGTRTITSGAFPLTLLPGESLLIDVSATPTGPGEDADTIELVVANSLGDNGMGKVEGDRCEVDVRVRAPACLPAAQADACADQLCVEGACEAAPQPRTCDDGDACTVGDACTADGCAGTRVDCDDGVECTQDVCAPEGCQHVASDILCDGGECAVAACRPDDSTADARGCVHAVVEEGDACTDDGVACTDDVCTAGTCLHVPVDTRCPGAETCGGAVCVPAAVGSDAAGCVSGPAGSEGGACAEDGDPCSDDRCQGGTCQHQPVDQHLTCAPVENAFRRALALLALTRALTVSTEAAGVAQPAAGRIERLTAPLARLEQELGGATDALSGRTTVPVVVSPLTGVPETPAQARARAALLLAGRMPLEARSYIQALGAGGRQGLARNQLHTLMGQGRALRRGVKRLKVELKRLRRSTIQFAR